MTTKFPKSSIQISGQIYITVNHPEFQEEDIRINLSGLDQSKSGVYEIRNKFNDKRYIGMARDLEARKRHHWWDLLKGKHKSKEMQDDFNNSFSTFSMVTYSDIDDLFEFNVIIYCYPSQLTFYENLLITYLHPEYNTRKRKLFNPDQLFDENGLKVSDYIEAEKFYDSGELEDVEND